MRIFYDTEFTGLGHASPDLISAGFVAENGVELYLEVIDFNRQKCEQFVRDTVLPLLDAPEASRGTLVQFGARLSDWLRAFGEPIELISDSTRDRQLVGAALGEFAATLPLRISVIQVESFAALEREYRFWQQPENRGKQHHALFDARCMMVTRLAYENEVRARLRERGMLK